VEKCKKTKKFRAWARMRKPWSLKQEDQESPKMGVFWGVFGQFGMIF
jgi:hypothetical protein